MDKRLRRDTCICSVFLSHLDDHNSFNFFIIIKINIFIKYVHLDFSGMFCGTGFVYLFHLSFICARIMKVCKLFLSLISWYLSKIGEWKWKTLLAINAKNWKVVGYVGDLHTYTNKYQYTDQQIIPFWEVDRHVSRLCLSFFQKRIISRNLLLIPLMSGCLVVQAHNFFHAPWQMGGWGWATLSL